MDTYEAPTSRTLSLTKLPKSEKEAYAGWLPIVLITLPAIVRVVRAATLDIARRDFVIEDEDARLADASEEIGSESCLLTPRCLIASDQCRTTHPAPRPVGDTLVGCHHPEGRADRS